MRKIYFAIIIFLVLSTLVLKAQQGQVINIGTVDTINSTILGEQRTVWVYVPNKDTSNRFAKTTYPVIYLLDPKHLFSTVTGMAQFLNVAEGGICPEVIVVGITNKDRYKELTPTQVKTSAADTNTSGGGENFLAYLEKEVMPYIEKKYPVLPYKVFVGGSLGGLMVMQAFINHYNMFNAYVVIDPSMWWDNQKLLKDSKLLLKRIDISDKPIFMGIANTMEPKMDTGSVKKDTSDNTIHIRSILELNKLLRTTKKKYTSKYYNDYKHTPVSVPVTYDALLWLFKNYKLALKPGDFLGIDVDSLRYKIESHFAAFSRDLGIKYIPPEKVINTLGNNFMNRKLMNEAAYLFNLNIANYPASFNACEAMGNFYSAQNNKYKAIEYFKKALAIMEVEAIRSKLKQLGSQ